MDITYIPLQKGFMYMTAIIDVFSRYIVGWNLSNSLDASVSIDVVKNAVEKHGKPEILNSDQGSQFTSEAYLNILKEYCIAISMDSKGRALDNIYIERFWRTIKYDYIYINPPSDGIVLYKGIQNWLEHYHYRAHQGINRKKPFELYSKVA
ncbi:DDE-type integrase/transposase/recombinase [Halosquirtibacter laminarini]|uniref:DDE-type integrase/transposase/recombinase n=1 Tax=Halosquirtibacter laminarini TaxID=3374600 RepID=A0AC61NMZ4_9BACT|nr:DDE-type integrase/transposase/recombinase [Prolixibacteraceae bacterium]